jgi:hypothetical protein
MNNNFLPYQLKKNAEQANTLATQMAQNTSQTKAIFFPKRPHVEQSIGVSVHGNNAELTLAPQLGVKHVRFDLKWQTVEATQGVYDFSSYDSKVQSYINNGIKPLVILDYGNTNYNSGNIVNGYIAYATAAAQHFSSYQLNYEIYNEPNGSSNALIGSQTTAQNIQTYFSILQGAYAAIKQYSLGSLVFAPALSASWGYTGDYEQYYKYSVWFEQLLQLGALKYMDAFSIHPYRINNYPETIYDTTIKRFKTLLKKYDHKNTPLVMTEIGWSNTTYASGVSSPGDTSHPWNITDVQQGQFLTRMLLLNLMYEIPYSIVYDLIDDGTDNTQVENKFGLVLNDGVTKKPAFTNIQNMITQLTGYRYVDRILTPINVYALLFIDDNLNQKVVAWTTDGSSLTITIDGVSMNLTSLPSYYTVSGTYQPSTFNNQTRTDTYVDNAVISSAYGLDANTILVGGRYMANGNGNVTSNTPVSFFGILEVIGNNSENQSLQQTYHESSANRKWTRTWNGSSWTSWVKLFSDNDINDGGLQSITLGGGISTNHPANYRSYVAGNKNEIRLDMDVTFTATTASQTVSLGSIPSALAPARQLQYPVRVSGGNIGFLAVNTDGTLTLASQPTGTTGVNFHVSYDKGVIRA